MTRMRISFTLSAVVLAASAHGEAAPSPPKLDPACEPVVGMWLSDAQTLHWGVGREMISVDDSGLLWLRYFNNQHEGSRRVVSGRFTLRCEALPDSGMRLHLKSADDGETSSLTILLDGDKFRQQFENADWPSRSMTVTYERIAK